MPKHIIYKPGDCY